MINFIPLITYHRILESEYDLRIDFNQKKIGTLEKIQIGNTPCIRVGFDKTIIIGRKNHITVVFAKNFKNAKLYIESISDDIIQTFEDFL